MAHHHELIIRAPNPRVAHLNAILYGAGRKKNTEYCTESNRAWRGFYVTAPDVGLHSCKEIRTVLPDPVGFGAGTTCIASNGTVSENVNKR